MDALNCPDVILEQVVKLMSISLCSNTVGQVCMPAQPMHFLTMHRTHACHHCVGYSKSVQSGAVVVPVHRRRVLVRLAPGTLWFMVVCMYV